MDILDLVTIKIEGIEYQYTDRAQSFVALAGFKGKQAEVTYHSPLSGKLVSEFYVVDCNGKVERKTVVADPGGLDLAC